MIEQLCFDFDTNPITLSQVNQYLISDPQVTGFAMADQALAGHGAQAVIMMRSAISQGTEPIALIGALAMKLRSMAKASAVRAGTITQAESNMAPWMLRNASNNCPDGHPRAWRNASASSHGRTNNAKPTVRTPSTHSNTSSNSSAAKASHKDTACTPPSPLQPPPTCAHWAPISPTTCTGRGHPPVRAIGRRQNHLRPGIRRRAGH